MCDAFFDLGPVGDEPVGAEWARVQGATAALSRRLEALALVPLAEQLRACASTLQDAGVEVLAGLVTEVERRARIETYTAVPVQPVERCGWCCSADHTTDACADRRAKGGAM